MTSPEDNFAGSFEPVPRTRQSAELTMTRLLNDPELDTARIEFTTFDPVGDRTEAFADINRRYSNDKRVTRPLEALKRHRITAAANSDILEAYLQETKQYDLLTPDQVISLYGVIERGLSKYKTLARDRPIPPEDEQPLIDLAIAKQAVYRSNLRWVVSLAKRYERSDSLELLDLIQEGNIGLDAAVTHFDVSKGFKFSTYATWWIKQAIGRGNIYTSQMIRLPAEEYKEVSEFMRDIREFEKFNNREPTDQELSQFSGRSADDVARLKSLRALALMSSLNTPVVTDKDEPTELGELISDNGADFEDFIEAISNEQEVDEIYARAHLESFGALVVSLASLTVNNRLIGTVFSTAEGDMEYTELFNLMRRNMPRHVDSPGVTAIADMLGLKKERIDRIKKPQIVELRRVAGERDIDN